jgi:hypothetical protein
VSPDVGEREEVIRMDEERLQEMIAFHLREMYARRLSEPGVVVIIRFKLKK